MNVFVYHTPELTPIDPLPDCAVVIDVLRATTTIATVLDRGGAAVQAFSDIDELLAASESWNADKRLRAGERGGATVEGCDCGNSPLEYTAEVVRGRRLFLSTTNGTRALERVADASTVLTAALVNRQAVVEYIAKTQPETVALVGSGWQGGYALEDTVCAGAILEGLLSATGMKLSEIAANDEAVASVALYRQWHDRLDDLMRVATHGQRLLRLDADRLDIAYCAELDTIATVPIQSERSVLVAAS
ncbi:MAG: 2-phosphosulfolactate phosphatase family protein [Geitlerinemataceae cyanobacterium]